MPDHSIEDIIRQAIKEGKFDDLPGKGKPVKLDQNPHQDPEWRVAHHLLKSSGFSLAWIERLAEINEDLKLARKSLERSWVMHQESLEDQYHLAGWQAAIDLFEARIQKINEQIRSYNLEVPSPRFQIPLLETQKEIDQIMNGRDS